MSIHTLFKYRLTAITMVLLALTFQATTTVGQTSQNGNSAARVGIDASAPAPLTLHEAIRLALANNNDIATSRIDVELSEHNLTGERGAYDPVLKSEYKFENTRVPLPYPAAPRPDQLRSTARCGRSTRLPGGY